VVHGDLKGANVLLDESRRHIKLTDFGCAKLIESTVSKSDINGAITGSLGWMAPEVLMNKGIRRKADVWSLGCLIIEMAVGGNPWGKELSNLDNNYLAMVKILNPTKSPPLPDWISKDCVDFITRCLTREYKERPTAKDMLSHPWIVN
jgi:serine/threonine protein kinase